VTQENGLTGGVKIGRKTQNGGKWGYVYDSRYERVMGLVDDNFEVRFQKGIAACGVEPC